MHAGGEEEEALVPTCESDLADFGGGTGARARGYWRMERSERCTDYATIKDDDRLPSM